MILVPSYWPYSKAPEGTAQAYPGHFPTLKTLPNFPEPTLGLQTGSGRLSYCKARCTVLLMVQELDSFRLLPLSAWEEATAPSRGPFRSDQQRGCSGAVFLTENWNLGFTSYQKAAMWKQVETLSQCLSRVPLSFALATRPLTNGLKLFSP